MDFHGGGSFRTSRQLAGEDDTSKVEFPGASDPCISGPVGGVDGVQKTVAASPSSFQECLRIARNSRPAP